MIRSAIVLAGGMGTRLKSVVADIPKPMAPVNGEPFLSYLLKYLASSSIEKVVLAVSYKGELIESFYGNSYLGMQIMYSYEDEPLGTGGGIKQAFEVLNEEQAFVINGDTFFMIDLKELDAFHRESDAMLTIGLKRMKDFDRYGCVKIDDGGRIVGFLEKSWQEKGSINGGVYLLNRNLFHEAGLDGRFSFETDIMVKLFKALPFSALEFDDYFIDIGIPEDYAKAQKDFKNFE